MIHIQAEVDSRGIVRRLAAGGHATGSLAGQSPVCAGVTVLLRTTARLMEKEKDLQVHGGAHRPGTLLLELGDYPDSRREHLKGITDYLFLGLLDLEAEFNSEVSVSIEDYKE